MNVQQIPRRLAVPAKSKHSLISTLSSISLGPLCCHRSISLWRRDKNTSQSKTKSKNPLLEAYLKRKPGDNQPIPAPKKGGLARGSVFEDDKPKDGVKRPIDRHPERDQNAMAMALDPDPASRMRWERRMVINDIRRRGHKTKAQIIKQTERESLSKSPMLKTSTKKLGMLARQIAGKTVDDALEQMRFSKKGAAQSVRRHLEYARDEAMVRRGMAAGSKKDENGMRQERPVEIELKDGRRRHIDDRTKMYIDQAWVGRGPYEMELELRARGKTNVLRKPWTSISVLLKEEATRVRLWQEKKEKEDNRKPWLQLPDRNVSAQHQYPLW